MSEDLEHRAFFNEEPGPIIKEHVAEGAKEFNEYVHSKHMEKLNEKLVGFTEEELYEFELKPKPGESLEDCNKRIEVKIQQ